MYRNVFVNAIQFFPQLLDCFSIPTVLILSWVVLRARYRLTHIGGMALGLMSVVVLVWADIEDGKGGVSSGGKYLEFNPKKIILVSLHKALQYQKI